jgi:hypothetical protein
VEQALEVVGTEVILQIAIYLLLQKMELLILEGEVVVEAV